MNITVGGLEEVFSYFDGFEGEMKKLANAEVLRAALLTKGIAQQRCQPIAGDSAEMAADIAAVRGSINFQHDTENVTATVFVGNVEKDHFAAYLEFGTGVFASKYLKTLPFEWEVVAWKFFVNGEGTMKERPYLAPTFQQESIKFQERLKKIRPPRSN